MAETDEDRRRQAERHRLVRELFEERESLLVTALALIRVVDEDLGEGGVEGRAAGTIEGARIYFATLFGLIIGLAHAEGEPPLSVAEVFVMASELSNRRWLTRTETHGHA